MPVSRAPALDCLIIGGGPAGLTAALYLARFNRRALVVDSGAPRAAWIPVSHNIPLFAEGVGGEEILDRQRAAARKYGADLVSGTVVRLDKAPNGFRAAIDSDGAVRHVRARRVILATGGLDIEPDLPNLPDAVRRGLVRYCPICDGYEAMNRKIAVISAGARGLGEAVFIARTYAHDVSMLSLGQEMRLSDEERAKAAEHDVKLIEEPIEDLHVEGGRIAALRIGGGRELKFDVLYSALGVTVRSDLAVSLGARHDEAGALIVDDHNKTSVSGLYAAGDVARGLNQIVVAMAHAAVAATHVHNHCETPTEDEPG